MSCWAVLWTAFERQLNYYGNSRTTFGRHFILENEQKIHSNKIHCIFMTLFCNIGNRIRTKKMWPTNSLLKIQMAIERTLCRNESVLFTHVLGVRAFQANVKQFFFTKSKQSMWFQLSTFFSVGFLFIKITIYLVFGATKHNKRINFLCNTFQSQSMFQKTAYDVLKDEREAGYIFTLCKDFDVAIGGGIRIRSITEIVGAPGVGKTQFW